MLRFAVLILFSALAFAGHAHAADATLKGLVQQAKAAPGSKVVVMHERGDHVEGVLTDLAGDVFCVEFQTPESEKFIQYCYPYASIQRIGKPGTGAHSRHTPIWVAGGN
jgi:hypothetical protein